jgi:hypothetical protein
MLVFEPIWDTPETIPPANEGDTISLQIGATLQAAFLVDGNAIEVSAVDGPRITRALVNGTSQAFLFDPVLNVITITTTLHINDVVRLFIDNLLTFELQIDDIPPGISVSETGLLSGTIGAILEPSVVRYDFLVRGYYGDRIIGDHRFIWDVTPTVVPITWAMVFRHSTSCSIQKSMTLVSSSGARRSRTSLHSIIPTMRRPPSPLGPVQEVTTSFTTFNGVLPLAVQLTQTAITGTVSLTANLGQYFFELSVTGTDAPAPLKFLLTIADTTLGDVSPTTSVEWITATDLGTIIEGQPVYQQVHAIDLIGGDVSYSVSPGQVMPDGLTVLSNGDITGVMRFIPTATVSFWIRATSGLMYADRQFTMSVEKVFADPLYCTASLVLDRPTTQGLLAKLASVPADIIFRPYDDNYQPTGQIVLLRGFRDDSQALLNIHFRDNDFALTCSELKVAQAIVGGHVLYDVVYREALDPLSKAGGYDTDGQVFTYAPKIYPENNDIVLKPTTIRNIRFDLTETYNLNTINPLQQESLGLDGGESLPLWMTCTQADGTRIGYVPAIVEGYAMPGRGRDMIASAGFDTVLRTGEVLKFERILREGYFVAHTRIQDTYRPLITHHAVVSNKHVKTPKGSISSTFVFTFNASGSIAAQNVTGGVALQIVPTAAISGTITGVVVSTSTGTITSQISVAVEMFGPLINTSAPVISGVPTQNQTLACSTGGWSGSPTNYAYQWQRNGVVSGTTTSTYLLGLADVGTTITCTVTASDAHGSTAATSAGVGPIGSASSAPARSAPTLGIPSTANPPVVPITLPVDAQSGDVIYLQWSQSPLFTSGVSSGTYTLSDANTMGGIAAGFGIPTLSTSQAWYFRASVGPPGTWSNTVAWNDPVAPTITTGTTQSQMELLPLSVALTSNKDIASWAITGGADQLQFEISGTTLRWISNGTENHDAPTDADTNNSYIVQVTATDLAGNSTNATFTVNVTAADKTADAFDLGANIVPATIGTTYTSNEVVVSGVTAGIPIPTTVSGMNFLYKPAGGAYGAAQSPRSLNVFLGDAIKLTTVGATGSKTGALNINGVSDNWTVAQQLDPSSLPNLTAWYDPSDLSTLFQDTAGTVPVTADGQTVALMRDKSGHDLHLSQPTAGSRPTYHTASGKSWLTFAAGNQMQMFTTLGVATIVTALNLTNYSAFRVLMTDAFGATDVNQALAQNSGNVWGYGAGTIPNNSTSFYQNKTATLNVVTGSTIVYALDGTGRAAGAITMPNGLVLGNAYNGFQLYGLVFAGSSNTQILSATDRHTAEDWLATKSGAY